MIRALILLLFVGGGFLFGIYYPHVRAIVDPCQAVQHYCNQENNSLGNNLRCGAERLGQLFEEPSRLDCMRTWLDLNQINNTTVRGWLDLLDNKESD